jgi:predicted ATPase
MLIAGHSAIGKSSLVREVMRPVAGRRGHLVSGKFDQLSRGTPYLAIGQACEELVRKLLGETAERVEFWRRTLLDTMGPSAQVVLDVVPGLERLVGAQPPAPALGGAESQQRFRLVFRRLFRALASPRHPLVIFLDDLQWADSASLALIELRMSDPDLTGLLMSGAYRDNEVQAGHPLQALLESLARDQAPCRRISLSALERRSVGPLIADTLRISSDAAAPLANLVTSKTQGNPFFVRQFLRMLEEKRLLAFDPARRAGPGRSSASRRSRSPTTLPTWLPSASGGSAHRPSACCASPPASATSSTLETLAVVSGGSPRETAAALAEPLAREIIAPIGELQIRSVVGSDTDAAITYRFVHDRLQQAAYAMIAPAERPHLHDQIGRLIMAQSTPEQREERLFEIVSHLNIAMARATTREGQAELAGLNLHAGEKAKDSNAYEAALGHFVAGLDLARDVGDARLGHQLAVRHIEAMYLCGRFEEAERLAEALLGRTELPLDKAAVLEQLVLAHTTQLNTARHSTPPCASNCWASTSRGTPARRM